MRFPKTILVDLDDTLICFDGVSRESWEAACATAQNVAVERLVDEISNYAHWYYSDQDRHKIGRNNLEQTRRTIVRQALKHLGIHDKELADAIGDDYSRIRDEKLYLFPGVISALKSLRSQGISLYLVTNGESHLQRRKIDRFGLEPFFDGIFIEGECGYGKPDRRIFRDVLAAAGTTATDAWIVGDNYEWEIRAPSALGLTCIWRDKRGTGLPSDTTVLPDAVVDQFSEILVLVEEASRT